MLDMLLANKRAPDRKAWLEQKGDLAEVIVRWCVQCALPIDVMMIDASQFTTVHQLKRFRT